VLEGSFVEMQHLTQFIVGYLLGGATIFGNVLAVWRQVEL
jgi:hypothetical protein